MSTTADQVYDVAVLGSGFAGSLLAMIARKLGLTVLLLERGQHPRVVIGESSTPLANLLLEELAREYELPQLLPLAKWGIWQRAYPHIGCGLKRGFTFYHHERGDAHDPREDRARQMLVAASPHNEIADTHWYRAELDQWLMMQAQVLGAVYVDKVHLARHAREERCHGLTGSREGEPVRYRARALIDATGPRGALHPLLGLGEAELPGMPRTQALFNHFRSVPRAPVPDGAPYAPEDAAVHHVFAGGWVWMLRFGNGVTSAGAVLREALADELSLRDGAPAWERLLARFPAVRAAFEGAVPQMPWAYMPRVAYCSDAMAGDGWALLPSAAGFVDPLLSTGIAQTLLGVQRIARVLATHRGLSGAGTELAEYAQQTRADLTTTARLVGALYATMHNFDAFRSLCLLYFAAVSYAETAKRLGRGELAQGFLLNGNAGFAQALERLCARASALRAGDETERFTEDVRCAMAPFDIAGLTALDRRHWYPVAAEDVVRGAHKLGVTEEEMRAMLVRCGVETQV